MKSQLTVKDPDAGTDLRQEEKGMAEDEMVGWHHQLKGPEFEQTPGDSEGQGSLAYWSPWGHKESDTTEQLNNNQFSDLQTFYQRVIWSFHLIFEELKFVFHSR